MNTSGLRLKSVPLILHYISLESAKKWLQDQSYDISLFKKNDPAQKLYLEVLNLSLEDINRAASGGEEALNTLFEKSV